MIEFFINGETLDLEDGTVLDVERNNVFIQLGDVVEGNFSLPFDLPLTEKNMRLTQYACNVHTRDVGNIEIAVTCVRNGLQHSTGKLKIDETKHHLNDYRKGSIKVYYLFGVSDFYQDIKDKKLRDIDMGGEHVYPFTVVADENNTSTWWGHVHDVMRAAPGSRNFAIFPVKNEDCVYKNYRVGLVNDVEYVNGNVSLKKTVTATVENSAATQVLAQGPISFFPYLSVVLSGISAYCGWVINGDILNDADFKKIVLLNGYIPMWSTWGSYFALSNTLTNVSTPYEVVKYNLAECLPDVLISEFLIALKNRMGWAYEFDFRNKIVNIKILGTDALTGVKDFTQYASPVLTKKISTSNKKYALRYKPSGSNNVGVNLTKFNKKASVFEKDDLSSIATSSYMDARLVIKENKYYAVMLDPNDADLTNWQYLCDNIYDYVPEGASQTEDINTATGIAGSDKMNDYLVNIPLFNQQPYVPFEGINAWMGIQQNSEGLTPSWPIMLAFYHGIRQNNDGNPYPYASNHIYDVTGAQVGNWGLSFECYKQDGTPVGLYDLNWKNVLEILNNGEELGATLYLPFHVFANLNLNEAIIIDGVKMLIKQVKETIPYNGSIGIKALRVF